MLVSLSMLVDSVHNIWEHHLTVCPTIYRRVSDSRTTSEWYNNSTKMVDAIISKWNIYIYIQMWLHSTTMAPKWEAHTHKQKAHIHHYPPVHIYTKLLNLLLRHYFNFFFRIFFFSAATTRAIVHSFSCVFVCARRTFGFGEIVLIFIQSIVRCRCRHSYRQLDKNNSVDYSTIRI